GRHYEDLNPAGFDPHERVKVLDAEGIDISVMYPGLGLKLGGIEDPELAVWSCKVYNDWVAEWCAAAAGSSGCGRRGAPGQGSRAGRHVRPPERIPRRPVPRSGVHAGVGST